MSVNRKAAEKSVWPNRALKDLRAERPRDAEMTTFVIGRILSLQLQALALKLVDRRRRGGDVVAACGTFARRCVIERRRHELALIHARHPLAGADPSWAC